MKKKIINVFVGPPISDAQQPRPCFDAVMSWGVKSVKYRSGNSEVFLRKSSRTWPNLQYLQRDWVV